MKKLRTILLIDDDTITSWINQQLLEGLQVSENIECIFEGQIALEYLKTACSSKENSLFKLPDLIFLDINMPILNGFELLNHLKELPECGNLISECIVLLTTSMYAADTQQASNYNVLSYLVKPLTENKVKEALRLLEIHTQGTQDQDTSAKAGSSKDRQPLEKLADYTKNKEHRGK